MIFNFKLKKIRIGFDFDGVIFYNPTKVLRPFVYFVKRYLLGKKVTKFYMPNNSFSKKVAYFLHKTSYTPNRGFDKFVALTKDPRFEVFIITARPSFMKENIHELLSKYDLKGLKDVIQNKKDEQPHLYKERLLKSLKLDYFVEDNWDIVRHLKDNTKAKIIWVSNLVDRLFIKHKAQGKDLKEAIEKIS